MILFKWGLSSFVWLCLFIPGLITLTLFQGHWGIGKVILQIVAFVWVLVWFILNFLFFLNTNNEQDHAQFSFLDLDMYLREIIDIFLNSATVLMFAFLQRLFYVRSLKVFFFFWGSDWTTIRVNMYISKLLLLICLFSREKLFILQQWFILSEAFNAVISLLSIVQSLHSLVWWVTVLTVIVVFGAVCLLLLLLLFLHHLVTVIILLFFAPFSYYYFGVVFDAI